MYVVRPAAMMKLKAIRSCVLLVTLFSSTVIATTATSMDEFVTVVGEAMTKLLPKSVHEMNERMSAIEQKLSSVDELRQRVDQLEAANSILINAVNECTRNIEKLTTTAAAQQSPGARHLLSSTTTSSTTTATTTRPGVHLNTGTGLYFVSDGGDRVAASFTHDENHTLALNGTLRLTENGGMLGTRTINVPSDYATLKQAIESIEPSDYPVPGRVVIQLAPGNHSITSAIVAEKLNRVGGVVIQGDTSASGGSRGQYVLQVAGLGVGYPYALSFKDCGRVEVIGLTITGTNSTAIDSSGVYCEYGEQLIVSNVNVSRIRIGVGVIACPLDVRGESLIMTDISTMGVFIGNSRARLRSSTIRIFGTTTASVSAYSLALHTESATVHSNSLLHLSGFYKGFVALSGSSIKLDNTLSVVATSQGIWASQGTAMQVRGPGNTIVMTGVSSQAVRVTSAGYIDLFNFATTATAASSTALFATGSSVIVATSTVAAPSGFATVAHAETRGVVFTGFSSGTMTTLSDGSLSYTGGCLPTAECASTGSVTL